MKKLFVLKEVAQQLKALGFNETCIAIESGGKFFYDEFHNKHVYYQEHGMILIQQAIEFLLEKYKLLISPRRDGGFFLIDVVSLEDEDDASPFERTDARVLELQYLKGINEAINEAIKLIKS